MMVDKGTILFKTGTYGGHPKLTVRDNTHNKTCESLRERGAIRFRGTIENVWIERVNQRAPQWVRGLIVKRSICFVPIGTDQWIYNTTFLKKPFTLSRPESKHRTCSHRFNKKLNKNYYTWCRRVNTMACKHDWSMWPNVVRSQQFWCENNIHEFRKT